MGSRVCGAIAGSSWGQSRDSDLPGLRDTHRGPGAAVLALGAIGLGAWTGHLDAVLLARLAGFVTLLVYRYWRTRRTPP